MRLGATVPALTDCRCDLLACRLCQFLAPITIGCTLLCWEGFSCSEYAGGLQTYRHLVTVPSLPEDWLSWWDRTWLTWCSGGSGSCTVCMTILGEKLFVATNRPRRNKLVPSNRQFSFASVLPSSKNRDVHASKRNASSL